MGSWVQLYVTANLLTLHNRMCAKAALAHKDQMISKTSRRNAKYSSESYKFVANAFASATILEGFKRCVVCEQSRLSATNPHVPSAPNHGGPNLLTFFGPVSIQSFQNTLQTTTKREKIRRATTMCLCM